MNPLNCSGCTISVVSGSTRSLSGFCYSRFPRASCRGNASSVQSLSHDLKKAMLPVRSFRLSFSPTKIVIAQFPGLRANDVSTAVCGADVAIVSFDTARRIGWAELNKGRPQVIQDDDDARHEPNRKTAIRTSGMLKRIVRTRNARHRPQSHFAEASSGGRTGQEVLGHPSGRRGAEAE